MLPSCAPRRTPSQALTGGRAPRAILAPMLTTPPTHTAWTDRRDVRAVPVAPRGRHAPTALAGLALLAAVACGGGSDDPVQGTPGGFAGTTAPPTAAGATACDGAPGRVLEVGSGKTYPVPSAAAAVAQPGDVVRISAGTYRGDVATWQASGLTICGVGGRAHLHADGRSASGKAIWVVRGADTTIDSIAFHGAQVPDHNGAGIRAEHTSGELRVLRSGFYDNQNGLLSAAGPVRITIEGSEFARSDTGTLAALGHNLYIGRIDQLTVRTSFFHQAVRGHNLKSRARVSRVDNSHFMDGPTGRSSYLLDFPDGGQVTLRGNLLHKGPLAENPTAVAFGAESLKVWPANTLTLNHNTLVMTRVGGSFLRAPAGTQALSLSANLWAGSGSPALLTGGYPLGQVLQNGNLSLPADRFPNADRLAAPGFWPTGPSLPALAGGPDALYTHDSPQPYAQRALVGSTRLPGALQSPP